MLPVVPTDLIAILTRYLVHLDKTVQERATQTLSTMMNQRPDLRPVLVTVTADFLLNVPDSRHEIVHAVLDKLNRLLKEWVALTAASASVPELPALQLQPSPRASTALRPLPSGTTSPGLLHVRALVAPPLRSSGSLSHLSPHPSPRPSGENSPTHSTASSLLPSLGYVPRPLTPAQLTRLEAIAMLFLCSPYGKMRQLALEILENARGVHRRFEEDDTLPEQRVHDIISETGPDLIQQLHQDFMFRLKHPIISSIEKSLEKVAASDAAGAQLCWSYCLGGLVKQVLTLCPDPVRLAYGMACARLTGVQPSVDEMKLIDTDLKVKTNLLWWKNYVIVSCAAAQPDSSSVAVDRVVSSAATSGATGLPSGSIIHAIRGGNSAVPASSSAPLSATSVTGTRSDASLSEDRPRESVDTGRSELSEPSLAKSRHSARQLLDMCAQQLKTDTVREAVVMALERTNSSVYDLLLDALRRVEKEFREKKGLKRDRLRHDMGAVFAYIAENMSQVCEPCEKTARSPNPIENKRRTHVGGSLGWDSTPQPYPLVTSKSMKYTLNMHLKKKNCFYVHDRTVHLC